MVLDQSRSVRKSSGGRFKPQHGKKKHAMGRTPTLPKIDTKTVKKNDRVRGGDIKLRVLRTNEVNLYDAKTKTHVKAQMKTVVDNPANRHYVRRNILTKGTIIQTDKGNARITSRPSQDGCVNAVLV